MICFNGDILHSECNQLRLPRGDGSYVSVSLVDHDMHSYLPRQVFAPLNDCSVVFGDITNGVKATQIQKSSSEAVKNTVEKVHKHICGHAPYSNIKLLLIRNNFWNDSAERYLNDAVEQCTGYRRTSLPKSKRKVSISSKSRPFNKVVRVDHFFFQELWLLHAMD